MKKILALILAVCLIATFAGCSSAPADESKPTDDKGSSTTTPSTDKDTAKLANVADFIGTWKLGSPYVDCYTIDPTNNTVTAYKDNGIAIGTFPVVATEEGIVLKMGAFGMVTLTDVTKLVVAEVPAVTVPDISGDWNKVYGVDSFACDVWTYNADKTWTSEGTETADSGSWNINEKFVLEHAPTKDLLSGHSFNILGGGDIIKNYAPYQRVYIRADVADTDQGKALTYYYDLIMNTWTASDDANYIVSFIEDGKVQINGTEMGIWYPTATGVTVEMNDGSTEYVEFTEDGIDFYYKSFVRK